MQVLPRTRRHLTAMIRKRLDNRVAPIVVVKGPRQIGKSIAQLQVLADLLEKKISPRNILRVQFDELPSIKNLREPILQIVDWYTHNILRKTLNETAQAGEKTFLFFDEVQNLPDWAPQLKSLVDNCTTQVVVTGSSALRLESGRDSLAGRISSIESGVLSLTEIGVFREVDAGKPFLADNGLEPLTRKDFWLALRDHGHKLRRQRDTVFQWFSERGAYPLMHQKAEVPWEELAEQLNETVVRRVIKHDLGKIRGRQRDPALLQELFVLCCRYAGQAPNKNFLARETQRALQANVGSQRIGFYLTVLAESLLIRLIDPLEIRLKKKRGSSKICLADHALRAAWLAEQVPLDPDALRREPHDLSAIAGHLAENVVGSTLSTISSLPLNHVPERNDQPEVDYVFTIGTKRIPIEVKYQKKINAHEDTEGLRTFLEKTANNAPFGLLITQTDSANAEDPRIISLPLSSFMLLR